MTTQTEALKLALEGAANYIDVLGGDSKKYRQLLAQQSNEQDACKGCNSNCVVGNILDTVPCPFCKGSGIESQQSNEQVEPVGALLLGGVFQTSEGFEFEEWDVEWNHKAVEALQEKLVTSEPVTLSLYTHPPVPTAQPEPLDTPLPCDVKVGHVTIRKGVALSVLVARMQVLYDMAQPKEPEQEPVAIMREMLEVQGQHGNWNYDSYMHGVYNGMEYMVALAEKREPKFRDAPETWLAKYEVKRNNFNSTEPLTEATPPQRTWVGLTDEEKQACIRQVDELGKYSTHTVADDERLLIEAVELKLREKNA